MIANSQPYNPSQQQQRCVGLTSNQQPAQSVSQQPEPASMNSHSQQNSIYDSAFAHTNSSSGVSMSTSITQMHAPSHSQQFGANPSGRSHMFDLANLQQSVFDSVFDDETAQALATGARVGKRQFPVEQQQQHQATANQHQQDMSLCSPSSSTSLLYHIYDQINLPSEHQIYGQRLAESGPKKNGTTTFLNPTNLFSNQQQKTQLPLPAPMQMHHHQIPNDLHQRQLQSQPIYQSGQYHLQPAGAFLGADQSNLMHQLGAATTTRHMLGGRPLSSSGGSSTISGQSLGHSITYGRQLRANGLGLHQHPGQMPAKSHSNLASTLTRLGAAQSASPISGLGVPAGAPGGSHLTNKWKRIQARAKNVLFEHQTIVKCLLLLILLAFSLMSVIKFTPLSASSSTVQLSSASHHQNPSLFGGYLSTNYPKPHAADEQQSSPAPQPYTPDELAFSPPDSAWTAQRPSGQQQQQPDELKSKLVVGEFVLASQNFSHSSAQRALLADRIVKLMDQVFASTELRRVYLRTEVANIRANAVSGVTVECSILLSESIAYAAQQFGLALYDSLAKSQGRLANQANYLVDKSSIRFNTVPDKDIKSGRLIPAGLLPADIAQPPPVSPSVGPSLVEPTLDVGTSDKLDLLNKVVWSEWSQWSACVNKEGSCEPGRIHSRVRKCIVQDTGVLVDPIHCRQRFNMQDLDLELDECSRICSLQQPDQQHMSDAPSVVSPLTAPSTMQEPPNFLLGPPPMPLQVVNSSPSSAESQSAGELAQDDHRQKAQLSAMLSTVATDLSTNTSVTGASDLPSPTAIPFELTPTNVNLQTSCSNCTSDEICLLLIQQKVPFCAKIKDRADDSGCGGWCKAQNQLCQPVGSNAFKCIHDSECLAEEWRCHDGGCVPLSKRCDGHANCYDSSDERDCPADLPRN